MSQRKCPKDPDWMDASSTASPVLPQEHSGASPAKAMPNSVTQEDSCSGPFTPHWCLLCGQTCRSTSGQLCTRTAGQGQERPLPGALLLTHKHPGQQPAYETQAQLYIITGNEEEERTHRKARPQPQHLVCEMKFSFC